MSISPRVAQIELPGGSGVVPTGAMQFQDDWPGLWIRGDRAIHLKVSIRLLQEKLKEHSDLGVRSALSNLGGIADIIERDVQVREDSK